jgi:predicted DNA-binding transcriptional regulator AlpA
MPYTDELMLELLQQIGSTLERIASALENKPNPPAHVVLKQPDVGEYISEKHASTITGLSKAWFQRMRVSGGGPPYIKLGGAVRYRVSDLHA